MTSTSSVSDIETGARGPALTEAVEIAPDDRTRERLVRWHETHGEVYRVPDPQGGAPHWVVHDPALVQQILVRRSSNYAKGMGLDRVRILLGNGIMVSEGDFWARQRRLIQPAFKPRTLADFDAMIFDENRVLAERWAEWADGATPIEIAGQISELTLVIVLKAIFGGDYAALLEAGDNPFALLTEEPQRNLRFAARFHRLGRVVEAIIDRRLAAPRAEFDFLGHMLAARTRDGKAMARKALVDEVMTLVVAGHETTASALAWAWYLLAVNPDVRARVQAEADALDIDALRAGAAADALPHTQWVIDETLRLYPPGWLLSRRAKTGDTLGEHVIAAGTQVFVSPYILHRHPGYWRDPQRFDPQRFADADQPGHRFAYMPFAAGPRHCVGEHLALTEMRVNLALLLRRFTPHYGADAVPGLSSQVNLRPRDGIYLQLVAR